MISQWLHKLLYRALPLEGYLRVVSRLYFWARRLGVGRRAAATEYAWHLPQLVGEGNVCLDLGANLGYYARPLAERVGPGGRVYAVEPVPVFGRVLRRNLRGLRNVEVLPYALGEENGTVTMGNDSVRTQGYLGTGQNFVGKGAERAALRFEVQMRRGSELFARLERLDFIKCDVEGYELPILRDLRPLIERFRPTVLIETGGENRREVVALFERMGYRGYTLDGGREVALTADNEKDIIFRTK